MEEAKNIAGVERERERERATTIINKQAKELALLMICQKQTM